MNVCSLSLGAVMRRYVLITWIVLAAVFGWSVARAGEVAIGSDGHLIRYQGQLRVLAGDSGTQCVLQNPNIDYRRWIDDCARAGLNAVGLSDDSDWLIHLTKNPAGKAKDDSL